MGGWVGGWVGGWGTVRERERERERGEREVFGFCRPVAAPGVWSLGFGRMRFGGPFLAPSVWVVRFWKVEVWGSGISDWGIRGWRV